MGLVAAAVLLAVCTSSAVFFWRAAEAGVAERHAAVEASAYVFASAIADAVAARDRSEALRVLRSISRLPDISYAVVTGSDGRIIAALGSTVTTGDAASGQPSSFFAFLRTNYLAAAVDIIKGGQPIGRLALVADISNMRRQLQDTLIYTLVVTVFACLAGVLLANGLQRRITAPIIGLTRAMRAVRDTRVYTAQVERTSDDETGELVDAFNGMIREIHGRDQALEEHRRTLEATVVERTHQLSEAKNLAESANRAKSLFLAAMSHEIRTPLNGLMVMAELLSGAGLDPRHQRYADVIVKSGESLLSIINDILDLSKIEAGKLELESTPFDPAGVAEDVASLFWEQAAAKGLDLSVRTSANLPRAILGDPVRFNQIVANFTNNALKFTSRGQVLIALHYDAGLLTLSVTDSGVGIEPEAIKQLFQAFSQADQSTTRKFGGTGLGLSICRRLAQAMGGNIGVQSKPGQGSRFYVTIPVQTVTPAPGPEAPSLGRLRAGIAFPGLATVSALGSALQAAGAQVEMAKPGNAYDVVFAAAEGAARRSWPMARKLIVLSTLGDNRAAQALQAGFADDLLELPLRRCDMAGTIQLLASDTLRGAAALRLSQQEAAPRPSFAGRRVMVADDSAVNREVLIEVLHQLDVTVQIAVDGHEAVAAWQNNKPDLIFMDCSMPGMDGFAATREIRAYERLGLGLQHTPIVALTALVGGSSGKANWTEAGMDGLLVKPFTMKAIATCLTQHFQGLPAIPPATMEPDQQTQLPVIDPDVIAELRGIGGNDALFRRVLDLFAGRVPQAVDKVDQMSHRQDLSALADAAHALTSMCANIGARRAVEACRALEHAAREGQSFEAGAMVATIATEMRGVLAEIARIRVA